MADFRRLFYALAVLALLAGLSVPVRAQAPPFACTTNVAVPPIVRGEGYTELIGDITLNCTGGIPTPLGQAVPPVNFTVLLVKTCRPFGCAIMTGGAGGPPAGAKIAAIKQPFVPALLVTPMLTEPAFKFAT